jgi:hypothetical protein
MGLAGPFGHFVRIVEAGFRCPPIGHDGSLALRPIGERRQRQRFEVAARGRVGLEIEHLIGNEREHEAVAEDAGAAEHAAHRHRAKTRKLFLDEIEIFGARRHRPYSAGTAWAGFSITDSPQPQAEVWFGLLKMKPDFSIDSL